MRMQISPFRVTKPKPYIYTRQSAKQAVQQKPLILKSVTNKFHLEKIRTISLNESPMKFKFQENNSARSSYQQNLLSSTSKSRQMHTSQEIIDTYINFQALKKNNQQIKIDEIVTINSTPRRILYPQERDKALKILID